MREFFLKFDFEKNHQIAKSMQNYADIIMFFCSKVSIVTEGSAINSTDPVPRTVQKFGSFIRLGR